MKVIFQYGGKFDDQHHCRRGDETAQLTEAALAGDLARANELHYRLYPLMKCMFDYLSPAPAKMGARLRGVIKNDMPRLPMDRLTENNPTYGKLTKAMKELGVL